MHKIITIKCLVDQTLVKNEFGRKVRVTKGQVFKTDSVTAETYLSVYKRHFALAGDEVVNETSPENVISLENKVQELQTENDALIEKLESAEAEITELKLEALRIKNEGLAIEEIDYNDLREIAKLKGLTFRSSPKKEELIEAIKNAEPKA